MNLKMKSVVAEGADYPKVMKSLTEMVNKVCDEINDDQSIAIRDIHYEQSLKSNHPDNQYFYVTAFIHYVV